GVPAHGKTGQRGALSSGRAGADACGFREESGAERDRWWGGRASWHARCLHDGQGVGARPDDRLKVLRRVVAGAVLHPLDRRFVYALAVRALLADRTEEGPERPVLQAHRIVERRFEMRLEELQIGGVTVEADRTGFRDNPVQRFVGETVRRGASTHV